MITLPKIAAITDMYFDVIRFPDYHLEKIKGKKYLVPDFTDDDFIRYRGSNMVRSADILNDLYALYDEMNNPECKTPPAEMIAEWCSDYIHPYAIDTISAELSDPEYTYEDCARFVINEGTFSVKQFMDDLQKLYHHYNFYLAWKDLKDRKQSTAYHLYKEGRFTSQYPFFEKYKQNGVGMLPAKKVSKDPKKQLMAEMQQEAKYQESLREEDTTPEKYRRFKKEPDPNDPELIKILLDGFPTVEMRMRYEKQDGAFIYAADIHSVFDIAWLTFSKLLTMDVSLQDEPGKYKQKNCVCCGRPFIPDGPRQTFCNANPCQTILGRIKNRNAYERRKAREKAEDEADE